MAVKRKERREEVVGPTVTPRLRLGHHYVELFRNLTHNLNLTSEGYDSSVHRADQHIQIADRAYTLLARHSQGVTIRAPVEAFDEVVSAISVKPRKKRVVPTVRLNI